MAISLIRRGVPGVSRTAYWRRVLSTNPLVFVPLITDVSGTTATDLSGNGHNGLASADFANWTPRESILGVSLPYNKDTYYVNMFPAGQTLAAALDMTEISVLFVCKFGIDVGIRQAFNIYVNDNNRLFAFVNYTSNTLGLRYVAGGTSKDIDHAVTGGVNGKWFRILMTVSVSADEFKGWVGAQQVSSTQTGLGTFVGTPSLFTVFARQDGAVLAPVTGGLLAIWNHALTASERAVVLSDGGGLYDPTA